MSKAKNKQPLIHLPPLPLLKQEDWALSYLSRAKIPWILFAIAFTSVLLLFGGAIAMDGWRGINDFPAGPIAFIWLVIAAILSWMTAIFFLVKRYMISSILAIITGLLQSDGLVL